MHFTDADKGELLKYPITPGALTRFAELASLSQMDALYKATGLSFEMNDGRVSRAYYEER